MQHILEPHYESTVDRGREQDLILAIQDTTTVNYHDLKATEGLDNLGGGGKGTRGLLLHAGMAINGFGHPLGLFMMDGEFRQQEEKDSARWVEALYCYPALLIEKTEVLRLGLGAFDCKHKQSSIRAASKISCEFSPSPRHQPIPVLSSTKLWLLKAPPGII